MARLASEFAVIVIGVLVALSAESWWSEQENRAYEASLRADIVEEFEENLRVLQVDSTINADSLPTFRQVATMDSTALLGMTAPEAREIFRLPAWAHFDPVSGAAQALVSSGGLWAIEDRELRMVLSRWASLLKRYDRYSFEALGGRQEVAPELNRTIAAGAWSREERLWLQLSIRDVLFWLGLMQEVEAELLAEARSVIRVLDGR